MPRANQRKQKTRKRSRASRWQHWRRPILIGTLVLFVALAWLIWPFWQLSGQFGSTPSQQPSRLYGRPTVLERGTPVSSRVILERLEQLHYRESEGVTSPGTFRRAKGEIEVFRRRFMTSEGPAGGNRLLIRMRSGRIDSLAVDGRAVRLAFLDPPLVASYYGPELQERRPVGVDELPEDLILSVLAIEDAKFLEHSGVSPLGILRAAWVNWRNQGVHQGGSTLTQQLVKNIYLTHDRTMVRKAREAILAILLELRYEKRDILQAYLNEIYWGRSGNVHLMGVGAAAWAYFRKQPAELTLAECALLAGMIQSPAKTSPTRHPERAQARRAQVLERLAKLRWVSEDRLQAASQASLESGQSPLAARQTPYFADAIRLEARERFGIGELADQGLVLLSSLDARDQAKAEEAIRWGMGALEEGWEKGAKRKSPLQSAMVSVDPKTGEILAYVGGRDYARSQFDRVAKAHRQAGSAFKPIVYAAAFAEGTAHPATYVQDHPITVRLAGQSWSPKNSNGKFSGWVTTREALERSLNVPTARLALRVGMDRIVGLARDLGVRQKLDPFPALALGAMEVTPLEMATVYSTLASGGKRPTLHGLRAIYDRQGNPVAGQAIPSPQRTLDAAVSFLVTDVLRGVLDRGTGRSARTQGLADPVAGKTGTTNDRRDSWFAGYSPERATLVWVGYDDNSKTRLSGARAALPIWTRFAHAVRPAGGYLPFHPPEGVMRALVDPESGELATTRCPQAVEEYFLVENPPRTLCSHHGAWRGRPLPGQPEVEREKTNRLKRWLRMVRGKNDKGSRDDAI